MKLVGLISGGKDSLFNMLQCVAAGHEIVALANIEPDSKDELHSYMYQSVGHQTLALMATALGLPIFRHKTKGKSVCTSKIYTETPQDEVEDLFLLLEKVKKEIDFEGVSVGAIASDYQRSRVENVCARLGLRSVAYLWRRNQNDLLEEMIGANMEAIIIKVASIGLDPEIHLGMSIKDIKVHLVELNENYGVNICGEGGEYETLTLDCPLFVKKIKIIESEKIILSNDAFAPVAFLNVKSAVLLPKAGLAEDPVKSLQNRMDFIKSVVRNPYTYIQDCVDEISSNLFPQHQHQRANSDILPFPFEAKAPEASKSVDEYWKRPMSKFQPKYSGLKIPHSPSSALFFDAVTYNFNYSTGWCSIGNITGKTLHDAFASLQKNLESTNYEFRDIVFVNLYLKNMADFNNMNKIYSHCMPQNLPPARACVGAGLRENINVLINVVAHKYVSKSQKAISAGGFLNKEVMNVQSISHWAPASVGPYSQCVRVGDIYYVAGQIPLIPGTMQILNKPILLQCKLVLRHVQRILEAMDANLNFNNVLQVICYVTSPEIAFDIPSLWSYVTQSTNATLATFVVKGLPRNAQMEWEVVACGSQNARVNESAEKIGNYTIRMKRCTFNKPYASSFVCKVSAKETDPASKKHKEFSQAIFNSILKQCLHFLSKDMKHIGVHLCMFKLFYKFDVEKLEEVICEHLASFSFEHKVVVSGIPVMGFSEQEICLVITGLCH